MAILFKYLPYGKTIFKIMNIDKIINPLKLKLEIIAVYNALCSSYFPTLSFDSSSECQIIFIFSIIRVWCVL